MRARTHADHAYSWMWRFGRWAMFSILTTLICVSSAFISALEIAFPSGRGFECRGCAGVVGCSQERRDEAIALNPDYRLLWHQRHRLASHTIHYLPGGCLAEALLCS